MHSPVRAVALGVAALIVVSGCAGQSRSLYQWGNYDRELYVYYKDPAKAADYMASLQAIITQAEAGRGAVPPGVYAEYGYMQLQLGKSDEAVASFRQEEQRWPESKVLMDHLIQVASMRPRPADSKGQ